MESGAIDFSRSWKEESRFTEWTMVGSLQHRVISANRIGYQGGGGSTSVEHHHVRRGSKYIVAPDRKEEKKMGERKEIATAAVIWMDSRTSRTTSARNR